MSDESSEFVVVYVTAPEAEASDLARALVERRCAACVNTLPGVRSCFRWEGTILDEPEALMMIKTTRGRLEALRAAVLELHPYDVPEVIAVPIMMVHEPYAAWIRDSVNAEGERA